MRNFQKAARRKSFPGRRLAIAAVCAGCAAGRAFGDESSDLVLDLFLKKGLVTEEEAARVKSEAAALRANQAQAAVPADSKWKIGRAVKNVELFGDIRMRFEDRKAEDPTGGSITLDRLRYSVRLG